MILKLSHNCLLVLALCLYRVNTINCDFAYGYETEDFTLAVINMTYTDPVTGVVHSEREEYGKYSIGRVASVSGVLVHVSSNHHTTHDACDAIDVDIFPTEQWVALAQFGNCRDSVKLKNIANTNASAAVIYSNKPKFRPHSKASNLISVFISKERGEAMAAMVDNGTRVMVHISIGAHNSMRYANINRTSVLFVSISFIVLMIISLAWLIFYYVQRFRYIHAKDILARRLSSAAKKAMDKIPTKTIRPADLESIFEGELAECCAVCIEPFKTSDVVRILPCKHLFHKSCVDPWLLESRSCPMCKMDILKHYGLAYTGSQESILNIDVDLDVHQHYWHRGRHRSSSGGEIEIVHIPIPIPSPISRVNRRRHRDRNSRHNNNANNSNTNNNNIANQTQTHSEMSSPPSTPALHSEPSQPNDNNNMLISDEKTVNTDTEGCLLPVIKISVGEDESHNESTLSSTAVDDIKINSENVANYDKHCLQKY